MRGGGEELRSPDLKMLFNAGIAILIVAA